MTTTAPAPVWGTWKDHGRPEQVLYFGAVKGAPWAVPVRVVLLSDTSLTIQAADPDGSVYGLETGHTPVNHRTVGFASKFWAAPVLETAKPKAARELHACKCGCKEKVTGSFRPGHDARFVSQLARRYLDGKMSRDEAMAAALEVSPALGRKLSRSLELMDERKIARKRIGSESA